MNQQETTSVPSSFDAITINSSQEDILKALDGIDLEKFKNWIINKDFKILWKIWNSLPAPQYNAYRELIFPSKAIAVQEINTHLPIIKNIRNIFIRLFSQLEEPMSHKPAVY